MKNHLMKINFLLIGCIFLAYSCGNKSGSGSELTGKIEIDGSSTVYPIMEAAAEDFRALHPKVRTTIGVSGTGGGFKKFARGETDMNNASRPITKAEAEACSNNNIEFIELAIAYDGIAVVVHPNNNWVDKLTVAELKKMWEPEAQNVIKRWNQIRPEWPDREIHLFGAGVESGTYDYFTEAIVGKSHSSRGDFTASEDDNVLVQGISTDELALGFFGLAYYEENADKLKLIPIAMDEDADAIKPTMESVRDGSYLPLSRPLFLYIKKESTNREEIKSFVDYLLNDAQETIKEVGYIPLEDDTYDLVRKRYDNQTTGTIFSEGHNVGIKLNDLMTR
jgi:phosphate transport system substrate-binding protein